MSIQISLRRINLIVVVISASVLSVIAQSNTNKPAARFLHQMTYDESNKQVLLYGGTTGNYTLTDLWALNSSGWIKLSDHGPTERIKSAFAYDTDRKKAVLFGGSGPNNKLLDDTWEWDGKEWKEINTKGPLTRNHPMAAYDNKSELIVMFGGVGPSGLLSDTWTFDGNSWKLADNNGPKDCLPHGMIYNEATEKIILITLSVIRDPGDDAHAKNSLWEWTGKSWKKFPDATSFITSSNLQALTSFGKNEIILFDGSDVADNIGKTWKFSGGVWTSESLNGLSMSYGHSMCYDKSRNKIILFGGVKENNCNNDLWTWDGAKWKEIK
jgi:hypothetical protein